MAETSSPCLVRSFSQPSSKSCDRHEGDLLRALTSSISFGRYMSESLAWEKWSAFTHNKYREEAERYSRPGSVAEKKAYFEARYKRIAAAKKSADSSLLEQQSAAGDTNHVGSEEMQGETISNAELSVKRDLETAVSKQSTEELIFSKGTVTMGDSTLSDETTRSSTTTKPSTKCGLPKPPPINPPSIQSKKIEHSSTPSSSKHTTKGSVVKDLSAPRSLHVPINFEHDEPIKTSSPILQKIVNSKFVRAFTNATQESRSQKSPIGESGISSSKHVTSEPDVHVCINSESAENANHVGAEEIMQGEEFPNVALSVPGHTDGCYAALDERGVETAMTKQAEQFTFSKNQVEPTKQQDRCIEKNMAYLDEKMDTKGTVTKGDSPVPTSSTTTNPSTKCGLPKPQPVKPLSIQSKKTEHSTPSSSMHTTKGKSQFAPRSLHVSVNFERDEAVKTSSPILQKLVNSKFVRAITNITRESRSQKSPIRASSYSSTKHVTFEPESRSNPKSPTANVSNKTRSSTTCTSFVFRSEERAMKRKEFYQKLEQKLKEEQQLQTKAMVSSKRTNETTVLTASRVKPNVTNHHTRETSSIPMKKIPEMQPCSPKLGRKPVSKVQEISSRPPWRLPGKSEASKDVVGKNNKPLFHSAKLFHRESRRENASPNIPL